jgi:hypothetical protein
MKELLSQQTEWNEHTREVTQNMTPSPFFPP